MQNSVNSIGTSITDAAQAIDNVNRPATMLCALLPFPHSCLRGRLLMDSCGHFVRTLLRHLSPVALEIVADHQSCLQDNRLYMARRYFVHDAHSRFQSIDSDQSAR